MPGEKPGGNPGDKMRDEFNEDSRELTPEEEVRAKELAEKRMALLEKRIAERKIGKEKPDTDSNEESESAPNIPKLKFSDHRSKLSLGVSSTQRDKEAGRFSGEVGRGTERQETNHNREIKNILNKFVFPGTFKLRTTQERGKFLLRLLSGVEGHKDTRVVLKAEGTMEDIKAKLENHLNHNYPKK